MDLDYLSNSGTTVHDIPRSREYHVLFAKNPTSYYRGDAGMFISAHNAREAKEIAEQFYPSREYSIVQLKPIR